MSDAEKLKPGDLVWLQSGSLALMVDNVRSDGVVDVVWFANGQTYRDAFLPEQLKTQSPNPVGFWMVQGNGDGKVYGLRDGEWQDISQ